MSNRILLCATLNWPSAARYSAGFHAAGCEVHALSPKGAVVQFSRYVSASYHYDALAPLASVRHAIEDAKPDLLVPCDDRAVALLLRLYHDLAIGQDEALPIVSLVRRSLGVPENYGRVISRAGSLTEMRSRGIRVPDTIDVNSEHEVEAHLEQLGLPAVMKADGSWGGDGVIVVRSLDEARAAFRRLANAPSRLRSVVRAIRRHDAHFLVSAVKPEVSHVCLQRFVSGTQAASAFAAKEGRILDAFHYDVLVADGTIGPPNVIRRTDSREMDEACCVAAAHFGLTGLFGLDFMRDAKGDVHLIEINPRATQGGTLPLGAGHDLASALAQTLMNSPAGRRPPITSDVVAFFPREWRRDPTSPYLREGYHDVPWDDPDVFRVMQGQRAAKRKRPANENALSKSV